MEAELLFSGLVMTDDASENIGDNFQLSWVFRAQHFESQVDRDVIYIQENSTLKNFFLNFNLIFIFY